MEKIRVLIADDSVVYRSQIRAALQSLPCVEIVGAAPNGRLALERADQTPVDLLLLDQEMPEMDGLATLREIQSRKLSLKVLLFSSFTKKGAEVTLEALRLGAADFLPKPGASGEIPFLEGQSPAENIRSLIEPKILALFPNRFAVAEPASSPELKESFPTVIWDFFRPKVLLIGSSTGGPTALEEIFSRLQGPLTCPVLIVQHMPPLFTASLAEQLQKVSGIPVKEATHGEKLEKQAYIAPGNWHMRLNGSLEATTISLDQEEPVNFVRPAVDPLFSSAVQLFGARCLAVVLTGMGSDGAQGCAAVKRAGGAVLVQEEKSCVVFGMPGAVAKLGAFDRFATPKEIAALLMEKIGSPAVTTKFGG